MSAAWDVDDDPDLRAAIKASLRDLHGRSSKPVDSAQKTAEDVIDLTGDSGDEQVHRVLSLGTVSETDEVDEDEDGDEDAQLQRAIEMSKAGSALEGSALDEHDLTRIETANIATEQSQQSESGHGLGAMPRPRVLPAGTSPTGLLQGLDRKQMEQERLARLEKKRKADEMAVSSPSLSGRSPKSLKTEPRAEGKGKQWESSRFDATRPPAGLSDGHTDKQTAPSASPGIQFPAGCVRKTWAQMSPRLPGEDIKIEEVLQKADLELAVLSAFMWDMDWVFSKADISRTRFVLVMQAKDESTKQSYTHEAKPMKNIRLCFPPMEGQVNCMHSKLMLLFHPSYVRIVVPTANLVPYDWGEQGGVMENVQIPHLSAGLAAGFCLLATGSELTTLQMVFLIDLPTNGQTPGDGPGPGSKTLFFESLVEYLAATTLNPAIIAKLEAFDFSQTAHLAFVHSIGGSHTGETWKRTGFCGLGRAVSLLGLGTSQPLELDYVTSSLGSLTDEFLRSIYLAAQGDDGLSEFKLRGSKRKHQQPGAAEDAAWKDRFRVYFPSEQTVRRSKGGPASAGTICFQSKWYAGAKFPRGVLRDCILFVRPANESQSPAWAYIGSANLSESAWGRLVQERRSMSQQPKLNCRNWECGVVVCASAPVPVCLSPDWASVFAGVVPVPMQLPARQMASAGLQPWFY